MRHLLGAVVAGRGKPATPDATAWNRERANPARVRRVREI